jgi:hypothetical protein
MGDTMICRVGARFAFALATAVSITALSASAFAAELPQVKISEGNKVPACATPGRLTAFLESRNSKLDTKFAAIAADYNRIGEELGIRWDTAFFQMLLETGNLTFTGDVDVKQNNFAGLGATGKHEPGESFPDVATGVKAHLQHLLMYAGEKVDNPVAERTRKVQEWGVLTDWQKSLKGDVTYDQLARKWAPGSRNYSRDIAGVAEAFYSGPCKSADPKPDMMALVHPGTAPKTEAKVATAEVVSETDSSAPKVSGADLARRAVDEARASGSFVRSSLGGGSLIGLGSADKTSTGTAAEAAAGEPQAAQVQPAVTIINAPKPETEAAATPAVADAADKAKVQTVALGAGTKPAVTVEKDTSIKTVALGAGTKPAATPAAPVQQAVGKCKVWTASYGGAHSVIIKASADAQVNYTVLDVNEGAEKREADAYIAAYAKGGQTVGEFSSQTQALDKAFELCPEG